MRPLALAVLVFGAAFSTNAHAQYASVPREADPGPPIDAAQTSDATPNNGPHGKYSMKAMLGGTYRRLFDVPFYGADFQLAFGAQWTHWAIYGTVGLLFARTDQGLKTSGGELGVSTELREGSFALGIALRSSYLGITRITDDTTMGGLGLGLAPFASFDLYRDDDNHALFLNAKVNLDSFGGEPTAFVWGPTLSIGGRY